MIAAATGTTVQSTLTLQSLPLFPLSAVLFPEGLLSLRVFEVRYLDMMAKCRKAGAPFGVVSLTQGSEVRHCGTRGAPRPSRASARWRASMNSSSRSPG
jgi:uncharacterized protein